ncbi:hypothetical protein [Streptomyces sp. NPDC060031]|uniref:hypothetical protein n=1 Tax=Streptomyces sp. NPDC060031 TaxID=3347043 RepID=UPI0036BF27A4
MMLVRLAAADGVLVTGDPEALAGLTASFQGFLTVSPAPSGPTDAHPLVAITDEPPAGAQWERLVFPSRFEPDRVLYIDHERRAVTVCGPAGAWRTLQALRTIRNLLRWQAFTAGQLVLHGGMVTFDGRGTAFLGAKRAGKTSSILSALLVGGASFVSNDDLTVELTDRGPTGHGWPRSVNVRTDTLASLESVRPGITEQVLAASHPTNGWDGEHRSAEGGLPRSVWSYPAELAAELGFALAPRAPLTALVLPRFGPATGGPRLERITRDEARELLSPHVETAASHYDPFLQGWYADDGKELRRAALDALLELPVHRLHQDLSSLAAATRLVRTAVLNEPTET